MNNETYILKMMQHPDRVHFEKAMYEEVKAMFEHKIWEKNSNIMMYNYYNEIRIQCRDLKRQQIMIIWSFKLKCRSGGRLRKYKARLYCRDGK